MAMNSIAEYWKAIESGEIVTSKEIKAVYKHLNKKLTTSKIDGYHYDADKAERAIHFIESFCHLPKVKGSPLVKLMLWQRAMISAIFGFVDDDGNRQYHEVALIIGRKNSKSTTAAFIALYLLLADAEAEPELYTAANTRDQAKILWRAAVDVIRKSEALRQYCKVRIADITTDFNGGIFKPLANDSNSLDGLNASAVFLDEVHNYKDTSLYDVMVDSTAMRTQPLTIITSTAGFVREGFYDLKLEEYERIIYGLDDPDGYKDPRRLPLIYKLDSAKEFDNPQAWIKANPGLGEIRSLSKLAEDVARAKGNAAKKKDIFIKFFCIPQTGQMHFLDPEEIKDDVQFNPLQQKPRYGIGGFDLSTVNDLTAAVVIYQIPGDEHIYVLSQFWMPEEALEKHLQSDKVPYDIWKEKGWLRLCPGNKINHQAVADWFEEVKAEYDIYMYKIGYDAWSANYLVQDMEASYGPNVLVPVRQGAKTLSIPLQQMKAAFGKHLICYNNSQLMKWNLANLQVIVDSNGNWNTTKNRNEKIRDDGAMALLDALVVYYAYHDDYQNII